MAALLKGWCVHCRGRLEAPAKGPDRIECPHCGRAVTMSSAVEYRRRFHQNRRRIWWAVAALLLILLGIAGYRLRTPLRGRWDRLSDEAGGCALAIACLAFGLLGVVFVLF